ncbi:MAG: aminopeptidase [Eubacteriales bacterium]
MDETKSRGEQLRKALLYKPKHGFDQFNLEEMEALEAYCTGYKQFLDIGKTERECVERSIYLAEVAGFKPFVRGMALNPGDKIYCNNRGKAITLVKIGKESLSKGLRIAAAHIDAPRIDLKPTPLYEENEMAWLKTHYFGGIRKYQWVAIPLELRGVIALKTGELVKVSIGSGENDPQFTITDLLPHLAANQSKKTLSEAITGEGLNILVGSLPLRGEEGNDLVKLTVLDLLNNKYGITEEDFISAELCAVPAFNARDLGFDRSMIGAYGQDDRVCSYAALASLLQLDTPDHTAVCMLADKEEIGSEGVTGMKSLAFDTFIEDLCAIQGVSLRECYENSFCLSADVTAAYDPNHAEVYDKRNSAYLNHGVGLCKYTGSRGKSGASDATAEVVSFVRNIFNDNKITWQMAELGKVDQGGGGTVAAYMAERNIDTLDAGVPVLSMHSPFETVSKLDCYMLYKGLTHIYES